jgi:UDP-sulfoquinovose synthase
MRVFIAGIDGYLGWPLAQYLAHRGYEVGGADLGLRRRWVEEMGSWSATPICSMEERLLALRDRFGKQLRYWEIDLREYSLVAQAFEEFRPNAVVHLGECPSAPYSMVDVHHATFVQTNNLTTTFNILFALRDACPQAHLLKLGTMGEYGTPNVDIPEGFFEIEYRGRRDRLPFPRTAGSWYHWSKVHGSNNIMLACKIWGIRATDVMQGTVVGTRIDEMECDNRLLTRTDFDQAFGTIVNRFCCQAVIGHPLTLYGRGHQKRGFLPLLDSMRCLTLAIENPPSIGEYRVLNQFQDIYTVGALARKVQEAASQLGLNVTIEHLENPRQEEEKHYYNPSHDNLIALGYRPSKSVDEEIRATICDLLAYRDRIEAKRSVLIPDIWWDGKRRRAEVLKVARHVPEPG